MDFKEINRINQLMKMLRQLQKLKNNMDGLQDIRRQQDLIRLFIEEQKDQFWRGDRPTEAELENLREKSGYDKKLWAEIVRELLGEPPPKETLS